MATDRTQMGTTDGSREGGNGEIMFAVGGFDDIITPLRERCQSG
jgi:hypothetical protein